MIIYDIEQGSEAWFKHRGGRVTGTRFKLLVAGESTKSYKDLVKNIAVEIITGTADETYSNDNMEKGKEEEENAAIEYENIFDTELKKVGFVIPDEDDPYHEWIGVSPDRLTSDNGMVEIKCPLMKTHIGYIMAGKLPAEYRYQVQGQLFVTGAEYCDFMSYHEGMKPFVVRVYPDLELFETFKERLDTLINDVRELLIVYNEYDYYNL